VVDGEELYIPLEGLIDIDVEKMRLKKEIDHIAEMIAGIRKKLDNTAFTSKAPGEVVTREREKLESFSKTLEKLEKNYGALV
jgi:valyl-tRNA synthetase